MGPSGFLLLFGSKSDRINIGNSRWGRQWIGHGSGWNAICLYFGVCKRQLLHARIVRRDCDVDIATIFNDVKEQDEFVSLQIRSRCGSHHRSSERVRWTSGSTRSSGRPRTDRNKRSDGADWYSGIRAVCWTHWVHWSNWIIRPYGCDGSTGPQRIREFPSRQYRCNGSSGSSWIGNIHR